ncbi:MAG: aminoglycoside phosphotransferase family protein [Sphaerochaeta sp.]|nr:aminoglycoside phosphotransferase family protein [Sphaerochaeta sp.]MDX9916244.1 aminoglycoside phosphotransferase family protein [Sphaerochaeta sp.]
MIDIDIDLAKTLIQAQFPGWADLPIRPVEESGNDNRTFRLGATMSIRLPSAERYAPQVEKECQWLPYLAANLHLPIPLPIAKGVPSDAYPWSWSVMQWLSGERASKGRIGDLNTFATALAGFLQQLHSIDIQDGPPAGAHNFHRGGLLSVYDGETRRAIEELGDTLDRSMLLKIWERALASSWNGAPVWVHGDMAAGNILVDTAGALSAIIDFGMLGVGDPACDLVMAWTFFDEESRGTFKAQLPLDEDTWDRGRGWALWKALITYGAERAGNRAGTAGTRAIIDAIVGECSTSCDRYQ